MKYIYLLIISIILSTGLNSQTTNFQRYIEDGSGSALIMGMVELVPEGSTYPDDAIFLISNRLGLWYRNGLPNGEYKLYVNGVLKKDHLQLGEVRIYEILEKFNGRYQIDSSAVEDSAIYPKKLKVDTLSSISRFLGVIDSGKVKGPLTFYDELYGQAGKIYGYNNPGVGPMFKVDANLVHFTGGVKVDGNVKLEGAVDTEKVTLFNADLLDGHHYSVFAQQASIDSLPLLYAPISHTTDTGIHVTTGDKASWNGHLSDADIHVTTGDKSYWNGKINYAGIIDPSSSSASEGDIGMVSDGSRFYVYNGSEWIAVNNVTSEASFGGGTPSGGENGDIFRDSSNSKIWIKIVGTWRQVN